MAKGKIGGENRNRKKGDKKGIIIIIFTCAIPGTPVGIEYCLTAWLVVMNIGAYSVDCLHHDELILKNERPTVQTAYTAVMTLIYSPE